MFTGQHLKCLFYCVWQSSFSHETREEKGESECGGTRTREGLEQDDVERPGQQLADLVDSGAGSIWETHGQVIPGTAAQQEANGRTHRRAHCYAASGQVREAQELHGITHQHASENQVLADFTLCCVLNPVCLEQMTSGLILLHLPEYGFHFL